MMLQQTVEKLFELRLRTMAKALQEQVQAGDHAGLSFEERLGLLVDREWLARQEQKTQRRLKNAKLKQPACIENIDYRTARGLDKQVVADLATCRWIKAGRNLLLTGPTGVGKSWLACSLAEKACREGFTALYTRVPRLLEELTVARADGSYLRLLAKLERVDLLITSDTIVLAFAFSLRWMA
jgi:DNA replication protein DnaC